MLKEIIENAVKQMLLGTSETKTESKKCIHSHMIGKKVMVRTYSAGVHFGTLVEKCGQEAILKDSRRVYSWKKAATLSQLSQEGDKDIENCRIAMVVPEILLNRVIEVISMSDEAIEILYGAKEWKM